MAQNAAASRFEPAPGRVGSREQSAATIDAVVAADEARVRAAHQGVTWERRGPLQRLTKTTR
ncbi:MAG: hypothetical protein QOE36_3417 [Gaiellaceae bacterium]|nr:hypothetical protein [Gaiellaceae bacterium]